MTLDAHERARERVAAADEVPLAWIERLTQRLRGPLPGGVAQRRFEPELSYGRHAGPPAPLAQAATVLILLYWRQGQWRLPLTLRPRSMTNHAGQVSLPGGRVERGETSARAALRETHEEIGVVANEIRLLGTLSPLYLYVSKYLIIPWVGWTADPRFTPNPVEVAELLEVPLFALADPGAAGVHRRAQRGVLLDAPHLRFGQHLIWGATAMILGELFAVVDQVADSA